MKKIKMASSAYPTRVQQIGEMSCFFLSCYKRGTFPICGIGPSWPFTLILLIFAILCGFYMGFMLSILYSVNTQNSLIACGVNSTLVMINVTMLILGICADPGVPPQIYRRYTKAKYGRQSKQQQKSSESKYVELEMQENTNAKSSSGDDSKNKNKKKSKDRSTGSSTTDSSFTNDVQALTCLDQDDDELDEDFSINLQDQDEKDNKPAKDQEKDEDEDEDDLESFGSKNENLKQRKGAQPISQDDDDSDLDNDDDTDEANKPTSYSANYRPKYKTVEGRRILFCEKCNIEVTDTMEHCEDCQVCVDGIDHHCVFFSKCIAKNNLCYFWTSLGMLLANFFIMAMSVIWFSHQSRKAYKATHQHQQPINSTITDPILQDPTLQDPTLQLMQNITDVISESIDQSLKAADQVVDPLT